MSDLSITAANVTPGNDATMDEGTAGATITAGQVVYRDSSDSNKLKLADQDAQATSIAVGIAVHGAASGQPLDYVKSGTFYPGATVTKGRIYTVSSTAGGIASSTDATSGKYVTSLGIGTATNSMYVRIQASGVTRA